MAIVEQSRRLDWLVNRKLSLVSLGNGRLSVYEPPANPLRKQIRRVYNGCFLSPKGMPVDFFIDSGKLFFYVESTSSETRLQISSGIVEMGYVLRGRLETDLGFQVTRIFVLEDNPENWDED